MQIWKEDSHKPLAGLLKWVQHESEITEYLVVETDPAVNIWFGMGRGLYGGDRSCRMLVIIRLVVINNHWYCNETKYPTVL